MKCGGLPILLHHLFKPQMVLIGYKKGNPGKRHHSHLHLYANIPVISIGSTACHLQVLSVLQDDVLIKLQLHPPFGVCVNTFTLGSSCQYPVARVAQIPNPSLKMITKCPHWYFLSSVAQYYFCIDTVPLGSSG